MLYAYAYAHAYVYAYVHAYAYANACACACACAEVGGAHQRNGPWSKTFFAAGLQKPKE